VIHLSVSLSVSITNASCYHQQVVSEKEMGLVEAMKGMGMSDTAYWTSWLLADTVVNILAIAILCASGAAFQLDFFITNDFGTYVVCFILFSFALTALAFCIAPLLRKQDLARTLGFFLFIVFYVAGAWEGGREYVCGVCRHFLSLLVQQLSTNTHNCE
jgi:hypothetical protein